MMISEVSEKFGIPQNTLRYYERIELIPRVNRNKSGIRDYNEVDCNWVEYIKAMRDAGVPIEVLIEYVSLYQKGDDTIEARIQLITDQRQLLQKRVEDMQKTLERLDNKLQWMNEEYVQRKKTPCHR
ncbi:MerR family transcriptional regulator [Sporomusa malonica]|uniref:Transcriptional regulator, MerR family n=1 Tax=Sporomusa malonica TaxID=112901 RepID=A0A1W1ZAW1_9FIRM|nr:MerR family transcriptional regulator [Sporomusa malonica]SMC45537.1 transcriptional regulator, MerR family [Sporomusa malonica]